MNDHRDDLAAALHRLRGEIRERVPMPAAAGLRARAIRRLRVRRTTTVLVAAAAVAALVLGGGTLLNGTAAPPEPPADTPTPSVNPIPPAPTTPSPRPAPRPVTTIDDPIADVDWHNASFSVDAGADCPGGPTSFVPFSGSVPSSGGDWAIGPADSYPAMLLDVSRLAYGDLAPDEGPEAIIQASCVPSEEGLASGHGGRLVVVSRRAENGTLFGRGWAGPVGAILQSWWVADGRLLISADLWRVDSPAGEGELVPTVPGQVLAYEWEGELGFVGGGPAPEYPPIVPLGPGETGPPVRLRAVAGALGCPDAELRFEPVGFNPVGTSTAAGARYSILSPPGQQYLFDLDNTGDRLLVVGLECSRPDRSTGHGLAVLERADEGWQGISLLTGPDGEAPTGWGEDEDGQFRVLWQDSGTPAGRYRWNGTVFEPIDE